MSRKNRKRRQQQRARAGAGGSGEWGTRKVTTPEREPVIEAPAEAPVPMYIPAGLLNDWSDEVWDAFSYGLEGLSVDDQETVWDILQEREDYAALGVEIDAWTDDDSSFGGATAYEYEATAYEQEHTKALYEMTDAEWTAYQLKDEAPLGILSGYVAQPKPKPLTTLQEAKLSKPGATCSCDGPGSVASKFKTHILSCAAYVKPVYAGKAAVSYARTCKHDRDTVKLDDGLTVFASGKFDVKAVDDDDRVDFGIYLDRGWMGYTAPASTIGTWFPWMEHAAPVHHPAVYLNWPDRKRPSTDPEVMVELGNWIFEQSKDGQGVEIGCLGGHGRTGTLLACLLAIQGHNPYNAVNKLWADYCTQAVEDASQMSYIVEVYELVHGSEWRQSSKMRDTYAKWMHEYFTPAPVYKSPYQGKGATPQKVSPVTSMFAEGWQGGY